MVFVDEGDADVGGEVGVFPDDVGAGDVTGSAVADGEHWAAFRRAAEDHVLEGDDAGDETPVGDFLRVPAADAPDFFAGFRIV